MKPILFVSAGNAERQIETPFGVVDAFTTPAGSTALIRKEGEDARARVWAAKESGAHAILALEMVTSTCALLEPGDIVIPADFVDQTKLRPHTFFTGKGYGFINMRAPFCPSWGTALLEAARKQRPRTFQNAVYVGMEGPREMTVAERRMYAQWGAHVAGTELLPEALLARELELCYAALTVVGEGPTESHLAIVEAVEPQTRSCLCDKALAQAKAAGTVGPDWKSWVVLPK